MERLTIIIQDIIQRAVELGSNFVSNFLSLQDLFDSPWIVIVPLFVIAITGLASYAFIKLI